MPFLEARILDGDDKVAKRWFAVYAGLREAIVSHRLAPGTKLPEDEIASIYAVSRTAVRSALQALSHDRLVRLEPNRGAFVAQPTPQEAREVFEARTLIEPKVAFLAAERAKPSSVKRLRLHLKQEHDALHAGRDSEALMLSAQFHMSMADIAGHSILAGFVQDLLTRSSLIIALYWHRRDTICEEQAHHLLVDAIEAHNAEQAADLMRSHIATLLAGLDLQTGEKKLGSLTDILRQI